jgi:hypothetical protein
MINGDGIPPRRPVKREDARGKAFPLALFFVGVELDRDGALRRQQTRDTQRAIVFSVGLRIFDV